MQKGDTNIEVQSDEALVGRIGSTAKEAGMRKLGEARDAVKEMTVTDAGSLLTGFGGVINPDVLNELKGIINVLITHVDIIKGYSKYTGKPQAQLVDSDYFAFKVPRAVASIVEGQESDREGVTWTLDLLQRAFAIVERHPQIDGKVKESLRGYQSLIQPAMIQATKRREISDLTSASGSQY